MKAIKFTYLILFALLLAGAPAFAQDTYNGPEGWRFQVMPYALIPSLDGTIGVRELPDLEMEANPKDIFRNLKFAGLLYLETGNRNWALTSDLIYMKLGKDTETGRIIKDGSIEVQQLMWEVGILREVIKGVELGIGGRYNHFDAGIDLTTPSLNGPVTRSRDRQVWWVDPIVIGRLKTTIADNLLLQLRGDVGGFGVASAFAWQGQAYADYKFSELFQLGLGYRYISLNYEEGSGEDRFLFDVNTKGPVIRFGFNF